MPGSHCTSLYDAVCRHGGIRTILCRNEQAGAFMADGFARSAGQPGVILTTAGPGATNALTGIAEAYSDSVPVLLIAGQVNHDRIDEECGRYHELDLESIFRPCTRFAATVMNNHQIPDMVDRAFAAMIGGRPGPASLFLPQDLMAMPVDAQPTVSSLKSPAIIPSAQVLDQARERLVKSQRPIILAGGGAVWSGAADEIKELAVRLDCPVTTTLNGKGIVDERSSISLGHARCRRARIALSRADLMLAIGCRFNEVSTASWKMPMPGELLQIDIDARQLGVNYPVSIGMVGDAKAALRAILSEMPRSEMPQHNLAWKQSWQRVRSAEQLNQEWLINTLRTELPENAIVFADACEMGLRMHTDFPACAPRTFFYPSNYAALGWGYPAAIGGAIGQPDRWVACVSGDGGFMMTAQELATAARYNLNVIAVVHNDSAYGAIKSIQRTQHEARYVDTDLNNPDFVTFGKSFGVPSCRCRDSVEFTAAIRQALGRGGPSLIEIPDEWRSLRI